MANQGAQVVCKSVFKSGESTAIRHQFTRRWIELINQFEKSRQTTDRR